MFGGKPFQNFGPEGYSLAHLLDHKPYKNRGGEELGMAVADDAIKSETCFGLFACVTNAVYLPNGPIRPTDFSSPLRNLLLRKASALYRIFCHLVPPRQSIPVNEGTWPLDEFEWSPLGETDEVEAFLRFRHEKRETLVRSLDSRTTIDQ
jgi:hypothetical protein